MRPSWKTGLPALLLLAAGLVAFAADDKKPADKADADKVPFAGNWIVNFYFNPTVEEIPFIVKIADKDGKPDAEIVWKFAQIRTATIEDFKVEGDTVNLTIAIGPGNKFALTAVAPKEAKGAKFLVGTAKRGVMTVPLVLEKTEDTEVAKFQKPAPGAEAVQKANAEKDPKQQIALYKEVIAKHEYLPIALTAGGGLFKAEAKSATSADEATTALKAYQQQLKTYAKFYGPQIEGQAAPQIATALVANPKTAALGLKFAADEEAKLTKELTANKESAPAGVATTAALFALIAKHATTDEQVATALKQYLEVLALVGPQAEEQATRSIAATLVHGTKGNALALEYAEKVEKKLGDNAPPARQVPVLKLMAAALRKNGKEAEAREREEKAVKIEKELDEEFEKTAIPFEPEEFKGRKANSHRVAVVELFTGAHCPPCVSADVAFDAAAKTFKPKDVVFLEYHLHIPRPDPLTNADAESRAKFYGVNSTPNAFVDGKATEPLGGGKANGKDRYDTLRKSIEDNLETDAPAEMQVKLKRNGDKLDIETRVVDLKKPDDKLKLHVVLVQDVVRYAGSNGQRLHHDVVRAFPGGTAGVALKDATSNNKLTIDLSEVSKKLGDYLDEASETHNFLDDERPTQLGKLRVLAFIQDSDSKEILQAAEVAVPEAK